MQELRVVALDDDGTSVVCEGPAGRFRVAIDDTLRAAVKGELTRGAQTELEIGAELSPRDIQARIRAGASVEEVASLAGAPEHRIKRFASPVLLERARTAELAQLAHPVRGDGPMQVTLADVVRAALQERGHSDATEWDAWKGPENRWVVSIAWTVGKSRNEGHFKFAPGSHGGTATPIDDTARDLLDPDARRALRSIERPSSGLHVAAPEAQRPDPSAEEHQHERLAAAGGQPPHRGRHPEMPSWEDVLLGVRGGKNG